MYQSVGHNAVEYVARALDLPLFQRRLIGTPRCLTLTYDEPAPGDEVEDLALLLEDVREAIPDVQGISVGAIASTYQTLRVQHV
jgi:diphthine-ammonia ligase